MKKCHFWAKFRPKSMNLKEKLLTIAQNLDLSKAELARQLGIAKSNFIGDGLRSELNGAVIVKFCQLYPQVSAEWLLRDEKPIMRSMSDEVPAETNVNNGVNNGHIGYERNTTPADPAPAIVPAYCDVKTCELLKAKDETILSQKDTIEAQRITIDALRGGQK